MQGRGLKLGCMVALHSTRRSPLMQGRGLKQDLPSFHGGGTVGSPLMQGRGLKLFRGRVARNALESPLMQGRGLKLPKSGRERASALVAPYAGAWIETASS